MYWKLYLLYCDPIVESIACYVETRREARWQIEAQNIWADNITVNTPIAHCRSNDRLGLMFPGAKYSLTKTDKCNYTNYNI